MFPCDLAGQPTDLRLRLRHGDTGLKPSDHRHRVSPTVRLGTQRKGEVEIEMAAGREDCSEIERLWQDTDDRGRLLVQRQRRADDRRVQAEAPRPPTMTQ